VTVDPLGGEALGLRGGDVVEVSPGIEAMIMGTCADRLYLKKCIGQRLEGWPLPSLETVLFRWRLRRRISATLVDIEISPGLVCQIDSSDDGMHRISYLKAGDIVEHATFGVGTVVGERAGGLWVRYSGGFRLFRNATPERVNAAHRLITRREGTVVALQGLGGESLLVEPKHMPGMELGSLVAHEEKGIGKYCGIVRGMCAVSFVADAGPCAVVRRDSELTVIRSMSSQKRKLLGIDGSIQFVEIGKDICQERFGLLPGDIVNRGGKIAVCVGVGQPEGVESMFFETEQMVKRGLGIGVFALGQISGIELLARIAAPGKVVREVGEGQSIELSVNTEDFASSPVLPADVLEFGSELATVVGIHDGTVYVQRVGSVLCEPIGGPFRLVYRRVNVPTVCVVSLAGEEIEGWIDLEHVRQCGAGPGDVIEGDFTVICVRGQREFVGLKGGSTVPSVVSLSPGRFPVIVKAAL
jgi:hypothetical protein